MKSQKKACITKSSWVNKRLIFERSTTFQNAALFSFSCKEVPNLLNPLERAFLLSLDAKETVTS
jgi:hypothetical protein